MGLNLNYKANYFNYFFGLSSYPFLRNSVKANGIADP